MKKHLKTKYGILNKMFFLKTGSALFLTAFVFCSLMAPIAAQFGSILFIALGMLIAPWVQSDLPEDHTTNLPKLPPAYVEFSHHNQIDHTVFVLSYAQEQQTAPSAEICEQQIFLPLICLPQASFEVIEHESYYLLLLKNSYPVRAGPSEIYC